MALDEHRKIADEIIAEFPHLEVDINEAYDSMLRCIDEGESTREEQDMFYWYIHKLKRELG